MPLHDLFKGLLFLHGYVNVADTRALAALLPAEAETSAKAVPSVATPAPAPAKLSSCTAH
jgi:hypothetical protein